MKAFGSQSLEGVLLGSGGWIPTTRRQTCSALFRQGDDVLVVDAGSGLQRLLQRPALVEGAENVHLVLTHFHLDHVVGLAYLPAIPLSARPVVWGAGDVLAGSPTRALLERLLDAPFFAVALDELVLRVEELPAGGLAAGSIEVQWRVQERHSAPTLALRIGGVATYCTDTAPDPANAAFAAGSHVLLHEAWYAQDTSDDAAHTAAGDAARIAKAAGVERLVLIHVNPLEDADERLAGHAARHFPAVEVGSDLSPIPLR
jgi:ribonuclease BN (tRNA processing enzyme)